MQQSGFGWKGCPKGTEKTGCGMTGSDGKRYYDPRASRCTTRTRSRPASIMQYITTDDVQRFTGSIDANWRPLSWMQNDGTVGVDLAENDAVPRLPPERVPELRRHGARRQRVGQQAQRAATSRRSSTARRVAGANVGELQDVGRRGLHERRGRQRLPRRAACLAPGASALGAGSTGVSWSATTFSAVKTLGYYVQEQIALRDRLFLTAAVRQDQNSAFGTKFQNVKYPKLSVSWLHRTNRSSRDVAWLNSFRFRTRVRVERRAAGVDGGACRRSARRRSTSRRRTRIPERRRRASSANNPGNAFLKPETSTELETGFEADLFNSRLHIDFTHYNKNDERRADQRADSVVGRRAGDDAVAEHRLDAELGQRAPGEHRARRAPRDRVGHDDQLRRTTTTSGSTSASIPGTGKSRIIGAGTANAAARRRSAVRAVVSQLHVQRREQRRHHPAVRGQGRQPR